VKNVFAEKACQHLILKVRKNTSTSTYISDAFFIFTIQAF